VPEEQQSCFDSQGQEESDSPFGSQQQLVSWETKMIEGSANDVITLISAMAIKKGNNLFTMFIYHATP
jgi:hypothetical protein